jgi:hypothetical protein
MLGNQDLTSDAIPYNNGKGVSSDYKILQRLRQSCRVTLERYMDVASQSSGHLTTLTPESFDPLRRANLALLKQKEDRAHEVYSKARAALLNYILGEDESGKPQ